MSGIYPINIDERGMYKYKLKIVNIKITDLLTSTCAYYLSTTFTDLRTYIGILHRDYKGYFFWMHSISILSVVNLMYHSEAQDADGSHRFPFPRNRNSFIVFRSDKKKGA